MVRREERAWWCHVKGDQRGQATRVGEIPTGVEPVDALEVVDSLTGSEAFDNLPAWGAGRRCNPATQIEGWAWASPEKMAGRRDEEVIVLSGIENSTEFDLDYDETVGETCRAKIDPWTGRVEADSSGSMPTVPDPDRTSRVKVNPWTGEVLNVGLHSAPPSMSSPPTSSVPAPDLPGRPPRAPMPALILPVEPSSFGHRAIAVIAAISLAGGTTLGVAVTLWLMV